MRPTIAIFLASLALAAGNTALAAKLDYELRAGGTYSDNIGRDSGAEEEGTIAFVGLSTDVTQATRRIDFSLLSDLDFFHYPDTDFDDEVFGAANADLTLDLIPNLLDWVTTDRFGKLQTNPFGADTPDNRSNFNNFSTGPELTLSLGDRTRLTLGGRYGVNSFEERDTDNDQVTASIALSRAISRNRSVGLTAAYDDIDYDDELNQDFERRSLAATFRSEISRGSLAVDLGINEVEVAGETLDGTLASVSFDRNLTARTSFSLGYDRRFSNAGDIFNRFQTGGSGFGETQDIAGDGEPFESQRFSVSLRTEAGGNDFSLAVFRSEEDFESDNALERQRDGVRAGVSRRLGSNWRISLDGRFEQSDFQNADREDDDLFASVNVSRRLTRTLFIDFTYQYADRGSSDGGFDFTENRYTLTLRFDPD
ncbi:outer membrane beta-barrel protein [Lentisalinibacter sediminis]|uniref:outer membrane beta-barrel protein n=1 Tax=Lentisalinibacter sediminis TaxID=2992237 RepID=UPI00386F4A39